MALGGGVFTSQNKVLPGSYINFVSAARSSASLADRGTVAMPFVGDWGPEGEVMEISLDDFQKNCKKIFARDYGSDEVCMFREIFRNAKLVYAYRLNSGTVKAANEFAAAKYGGSRGNDLSVAIQADVDEDGEFYVYTYLDGVEMDMQSVRSAEELTDNDFVSFKASAELSVTAGTPLTGGSDGTGRTGDNYQTFLDKIEKYQFNALGCNTDAKEITDLFTAFTKRMRDEVGAKFQTVVFRAENADYEGVISVENKLLDVDENQYGEFSLVYWVTGAVGGCAVNKSLTNKVYDGEYKVDTDYTQKELENAIQSGKFILHNVGDDVRVLDDINTFVSFTDDKNSDFGSNQTVRVIDQIANDIATLFNAKYLGSIPNNDSGRVSLKVDIIKHHKTLQDMGAIEDFSDDDVEVYQGDSKKSVVISDAITVANAMTQLYMTTVVA